MNYQIAECQWSSRKVAADNNADCGQREASIALSNWKFKCGTDGRCRC